MSMTENGKKIRDMALVNTHSQMVMSMKENGRITRGMVVVNAR